MYTCCMYKIHPCSRQHAGDQHSCKLDVYSETIVHVHFLINRPQWPMLLPALNIDLSCKGPFKCTELSSFSLNQRYLTVNYSHLGQSLVTYVTSKLYFLVSHFCIESDELFSFVYIHIMKIRHKFPCRHRWRWNVLNFKSWCHTRSQRMVLSRNVTAIFYYWT